MVTFPSQPTCVSFIFNVFEEQYAYWLCRGLGPRLMKVACDAGAGGEGSKKSRSREGVEGRGEEREGCCNLKQNSEKTLTFDISLPRFLNYILKPPHVNTEEHSLPTRK